MQIPLKRSHAVGRPVLFPNNACRISRKSLSYLCKQIHVTLQGWYFFRARRGRGPINPGVGGLPTPHWALMDRAMPWGHTRSLTLQTYNMTSRNTEHYLQSILTIYYILEVPNTYICFSFICTKLNYMHGKIEQNLKTWSPILLVDHKT